MTTDTVVGAYRLGPVLGRGGMAVVHRATHERHGRTVALKLLTGELAQDPSFAERFRREGRAQAALEHPNVVTVYEAGTWEDGLYLAMQLVDGPTLAALIDGGALTAPRTLALMRQVAGALDALHAAGLVHRDVKPRNVLVAEGDHAYLADFGLTKSGEAEGLTVAGSLLGTVAYLAPEVIKGEPATGASDRYAFAAMLFECLSGTAVFPRPTHAALLYAHTNEPPPHISARRADLPAALDDVFVAALAKRPADRPRSATALVGEVERVLGGLDLGPPPRNVPSPVADTTEPVAVAPGARPRRRWPALAAAALAGAVLGGTAVALIGDDPAPEPAGISDLPGARALGSDLSRPGKPAGCGDGPCTILQERLGGASLVVQRPGVVRRWVVRSARGELALSVLRRRGEGYFQIARSRNEFVGDGTPHAFATELEVEAGDRLALLVVGGSGAGLRATAGGTTATWSPPLRGDILPSRTGPAGELLLRVDYVPGGRPARPPQVNGAAAARLPDGEVVRRQTIRMANDVTVKLLVVRIDGRYSLDVLRGDRRVARMAVPGLAGEGRFVTFDAAADDVREQFYVFMEWVGLNSQRIVSHYVEGNAGELFFYD
jgi:hypothetical protein